MIVHPDYCSDVNLILPPNDPSCMPATATGDDGIHTAGSLHAGGCSVLLTDGSVRFISEYFDAGNQGANSRSPTNLKRGRELA